MFTNTINIDIAMHNLQHTSLCIICISSSVVHHTQDHISPTYIYSIKVIQQKISTSRRRERPWITLRELLPPSPDILGALALIGRWRHHHRLPSGLLLCLLSGLLLPLGLLILPSSIDISSQCGVVLLCLLKFFLD
jgi:hypothetical protein